LRTSGDSEASPSELPTMVPECYTTIIQILTLKRSTTVCTKKNNAVSKQWVTVPDFQIHCDRNASQIKRTASHAHKIQDYGQRPHRVRPDDGQSDVRAAPSRRLRQGRCKMQKADLTASILSIQRSHIYTLYLSVFLQSILTRSKGRY